MDNTTGGIFLSLFFLVFIGMFVIAFAGMWKMFEKAGHPGWAALIPIYNMFLLIRIAGKPDVWIVFMFIPVANLIIGILIAIEVAKRFGKGTGFGVGMILLPVVFYPILGFGDAVYQPAQIQGGQPLPRPA